MLYPIELWVHAPKVKGSYEPGMRGASPLLWGRRTLSVASADFMLVLILVLERLLGCFELTGLLGGKISKACSAVIPQHFVLLHMFEDEDENEDEDEEQIGVCGVFLLLSTHERHKFQSCFYIVTCP